MEKRHKKSQKGQNEGYSVSIQFQKLIFKKNFLDFRAILFRYRTIPGTGNFSKNFPLFLRLSRRKQRLYVVDYSSYNGTGHFRLQGRHGDLEHIHFKGNCILLFSCDSSYIYCSIKVLEASTKASDSSS